LAAAALTWGIIELRREPPRMFVSSILPPEKTEFAFATNGAPALSPDGKRIAFVAGPSAGPRMLYVRALSGNAAQPLAGTEEATFPFWSPDSRSIAFFAGGKLKKIDAGGGPAQTLADALAGRGGSWSSRGVIVFAPFLAGTIYKVSDSGGAATPVTRGDPKHVVTQRWPSFLPDGRHFLFMTSKAGATDRSIFVGSIDGDLQKQLTNANSNAVYSLQGYLLYILDRALVAQSLDPKSLTVGRDAVPIAEVLTNAGRWDAFFSVSNNGLLAYQAGAGIELSQLLWIDDHGKAVGSVGKQGDYQSLSLSHDGRRVAVTVTDPATRHWALWVDDLSRGTSTRLTFDPMNEWWPIWSPDDSMILYSSNARGAAELMMKRSSGTGTEERVYSSGALTVATDWSRDGKTILFHEQGGPGSNNWDLWLYSLQEHKARILLQTPYIECCGKFSPDGRWVAYQSDESGKFQIYVLPASGNAGKWMISTDGGIRAQWSRDGKRIYYTSPDSKLMAVDVNARGDEFMAGVPQMLFGLNLKPTFGQQYDVSADGKRFLVNSPMQQGEMAPITVVQNWTAALKK
jgi:Tol biopolymer transport system component